MNTRAETLKARVAAVNRGNDYANKLYRELTNIFRPLVGQKILKADGTLLAKYQPLLPHFPSTPQLHVYRHTSEYSLAWSVKTCESLPPHSCMYHTATVYIGDLSGDKLEKLSVNPFEGRTDFTAAEIESKRADYEAAKRIADNARNALWPFGENDN